VQQRAEDHLFAPGGRKVEAVGDRRDVARSFFGVALEDRVRIINGRSVSRWYYTCPGRRTGGRIERRKRSQGEGPPGTEGRKIVVSKTHSLRWLENLKQSQRLTAREERRKKEILEVFRELHDISARQPDPPVFPPWRPSW
jgi:hypothetical protein